MAAIANPSTMLSTGFHITVVTPKNGTTTKKIEGDTLSVGRASDCDLTIPHDTLSRRHMTVTLKNGLCWVEDHGSSNGTFVNGKRIKAHQATSVLPEDTVQLGQSGVRLSVSVEPQMWKGEAPPAPQADEPPRADTIVTSTITQRRLKMVSQPTPEAKPPELAQEQAEKLVQDAQLKVAGLIQEAELEAERRVQDIYRRAHETQAKMDDIYQKRMNEAYRAAEKMYQKSQAESEVILDQARLKSTEIRNQAEGFVMELRNRTEEDCERILEEAQVTARELKENRLLEAEEMIRKKEDELVKNAREAMSTRLARFEEDLLKEAARQRELLEGELQERRNQLEVDQKDQIEAVKRLKIEVKALSERRDEEQGKVKELELATERLEATKKEISEHTKAMAQMRTELDQMSKAREESKASLKKLKEAQEGVDGEMLKLRSKFEEDKVKLHKEEQKHLEQLKLETTRKVRVMEEELVGELLTKKERLGREIGLTIESHLKAENKDVKKLQDEVKKLLDQQIVTMSTDPAAKTKQKSLVTLRRWEKFKTVTMSLMVGAVLAVGGQKAHRYAKKAEQAPMQRKVAAAAEERRLDLERRKFNPTQTAELKATYVDAVIYTEGFTQAYLSEEFQRKFLSAVTPYLLKTWRVDEDKVIELIAASATLVKNLSERKEAIHPDFVQQGLDKMKDLEADSLTRMRTILGSQVRVESYRKFERKFYEEWRIKAQKN